MGRKYYLYRGAVAIGLQEEIIKGIGIFSSKEPSEIPRRESP